MPKNNDISVIVPARDYDNIVKLQDPDVLDAFLQEPAAFVAELVTGLMEKGRSGIALSGSHLAQAAFKSRLLRQFAEEVNYFRNAGKIPEDFAEKKYGYQTWMELLKIIDEESPDEDRIEALKAMFLDVNRAGTADGERIVPYQLWQLTKKLTSGELLLLKACYESIHFFGGGETSYTNWRQKMAVQCGNMPSSMIDLYQKNLTELQLLSPLVYSDHSGIIPLNARLTDLGMRLCQNIRTYKQALPDDE